MEDLLDVVADVLDDNLAALDSGLLADGQQQAQAGTTDVLQVLAVEGDFLVGILQQGNDFGSPA